MEGNAQIAEPHNEAYWHVALMKPPKWNVNTWFGFSRGSENKSCVLVVLELATYLEIIKVRACWVE